MHTKIDVNGCIQVAYSIGLTSDHIYSLLIFTVLLFCTAKNVVLAGVKSVTIHDPDAVELSHLSSQVFQLLPTRGDGGLGGEGGSEGTCVICDIASLAPLW